MWSFLKNAVLIYVIIFIYQQVVTALPAVARFFDPFHAPLSELLRDPLGKLGDLSGPLQQLNKIGGDLQKTIDELQKQCGAACPIPPKSFDDIKTQASKAADAAKSAQSTVDDAKKGIEKQTGIKLP